jgi:ADP-dependent NAD(P)H-hydrate dehydratase / NAD(P)H-hydrate epimerase
VNDRAVEPLYTAAEMRAAEQRYPGYPDSMAELMERAGRAVAEHVVRRFSGKHAVTVVCGPGSNGGDGRIAAGVLRKADRGVTVVESKPEDEEKQLGEPGVIVDALFGTGFAGEPRPGAARLIEQMNAAGVPILAVDLPSGVDASTGEVAGAAVRASETVTMHGQKLGLQVAPGRFHAGDVTVVDIGLAPAETEHGLVTRDLLDRVPRKGPGDNKYSAGSVLVVGGSRGLTGAACLAAEAAFRADAGYVAVAVPASTLPVFEQRLLEAVKRPLAEDGDGRLVPEAVEAILEHAERATAVALGPGLGRSEGTKKLVGRLLQELDRPVVVDADGLFELEAGDTRSRRRPTVLTPHAGELARMLGEESAWVSAHRLEAARRGTERFGCVCLLKGADTLVAAPDVGLLVSALGPPALATAGTGDVLTGIVAAFLAKGMEPRLAAAAAAAAQQVSAGLAPAQVGLVASDVIASLPRALDPK